MTMEGRTAAKLADALDNMLLTPPDTLALPAAMSMLCEDAGAFLVRSTRVDAGVRAFDEARYRFRLSTTRGGYSAELWSRSIEAAGVLASALRELGELGATRCGAEEAWGRCKVAVDAGNPCPYHAQIKEPADSAS